MVEAVGVFSTRSSEYRIGLLTSLFSAREFRFEAFPELAPSESSSSSSSERSSPRSDASACSLARRAALTDCCAALLLDFLM
jgi:hypothetical protein